jgi:hypothetical protein
MLMTPSWLRERAKAAQVLVTPILRATRVSVSGCNEGSTAAEEEVEEEVAVAEADGEMEAEEVTAAAGAGVFASPGA